jgi:hypothetical protein
MRRYEGDRVEMELGEGEGKMNCTRSFEYETPGTFGRAAQVIPASRTANELLVRHPQAPGRWDERLTSIFNRRN